MVEREKTVKVFSKMMIMKLNFPFLTIKTVHGLPKVRNEFHRAPDHGKWQGSCLQPWAKLWNSGVVYQNKDQRKRNPVSDRQVSIKNTPQKLSLQKQTDSKHLLLMKECYPQVLFLWGSARSVPYPTIHSFALVLEVQLQPLP